MKTIGEKIKEQRIKANFTLDMLAKQIGVTASTINKYENGTVNIPSDKIEKISRVLNCSPAYFMGWDNEPEMKEIKFDLSILTKSEREKVENLINMTDIMFMTTSKQEPLSENDRNTIINAYIDVLISRRKKKNG